MDKLSRNCVSITGASKTILRKKLAKCGLDDVIRILEYWITNLELLREYLQNIDVNIDDSENMNHIISKFLEEYQTIVEILGDKLDDKDNPLTIERFHDNILVEFDRITKNRYQELQEKMKYPFT